MRFIPLIEKKEVENNKDNLADYLWKPILDVLGYVPKNIYFAPSGLLYQIPIESHKLSDGRYMCDAFNMYRMSSTRWLCIDSKNANSLEAVIYGGIQYDELTDLTNTSSLTENLRGNRESSSSLPYLPATFTEAQTINNLIDQHPFTKCTLITGNTASEKSFKQLSGRKTQLIHVATHGVFEKREEKYSDILSMYGLCFTGANSVLNGDFFDSSIDGILTAKEISDMDLNGLELIVLSACETGLGNISYDGVLGLQRGLKKAGANAILMSLWKVDDEATCLLMTEFYKNWVRGMKKTDALEKAKKTIRDYPNWNNPRYWSAFILLDGLN